MGKPGQVSKKKRGGYASWDRYAHPGTWDTYPLGFHLHKFCLAGTERDGSLPHTRWYPSINNLKVLDEELQFWGAGGLYFEAIKS